MTIKRIEALALGEVLGSLMGSVIDAQAQSARATAAFVEDVGFETTPEGDRLRTVKLRYSKRDENGEPAEFVVEMPLLAMVNVPSLAVKEAKLSFSYDVVVAASDKEEGGGAPEAPAGRLDYRPAKFKGFVRSKPAPSGGGVAARRTTAVDLDVTLEQRDAPIGVERLFDLAELGILEDKAE